LALLVLSAVTLFALLVVNTARASDPGAPAVNNGSCPDADAVTAAAGTDVNELQKMRREASFTCRAIIADLDANLGVLVGDTGQIANVLRCVEAILSGAAAADSVAWCGPEAGVTLATLENGVKLNGPVNVKTAPGDSVHCVTGSPAAPCSSSGGGAAATVGLDPTANTVQLDAEGVKRADLAWWGSWACVGLLLALLVVPRLIARFQLWRGD
jgi:hypothetical protein